MAERAGLENRILRKRDGGSNPSLSETSHGLFAYPRRSLFPVRLSVSPRWLRALRRENGLRFFISDGFADKYMLNQFRWNGITNMKYFGLVSN